MILSPSSREDGQWTVLDTTGKSVAKDNFPSREAALAWIMDNGHTAFDSQGEHIASEALAIFSTGGHKSPGNL